MRLKFEQSKGYRVSITKGCCSMKSYPPLLQRCRGCKFCSWSIGVGQGVMCTHSSRYTPGPGRRPPQVSSIPECSLFKAPPPSPPPPPLVAYNGVVFGEDLISYERVCDGDGHLLAVIATLTVNEKCSVICHAHLPRTSGRQHQATVKPQRAFNVLKREAHESLKKAFCDLFVSFEEDAPHVVKNLSSVHTITLHG